MQTKLPYPLIALDLDGTLTNHDKVITPDTLKALHHAQDEGATLVIASGRPTFGIKPLIHELEMDTRGGYILSYNGGRIVDTVSREVLYKQRLPSEVLPVLYQYAKEHQHALLGYIGPDIITEMPDDKYAKEEEFTNKMTLRRVPSLLEALEPHPSKLLMTGDPEQMVVAEKALNEQLGDQMDIFRSAPYFLELVPKGVDKAHTLQRLLEIKGLTREQVIAFGDGYNDLSMILFAGMGVAMGNGVPEVKEKADYVTLSNEEDGIAAALYHFGLSQPE